MRQARAIEVGSYGVRHPFGLAYGPAEDTFYTLSTNGRAGGASTDMALGRFNSYGDPLGQEGLEVMPASPVHRAIAAGARQPLLFYQPPDEMIAVTMQEGGVVGRARATVLDVRQFGVSDLRGVTVDPERGRLFIVDGAGARVLCVDLVRELNGGFDVSGHAARVSAIAIGSAMAAGARGIAFNPADGHLYLMDMTGLRLYKIAETGRVAAIIDITEARLRSPQTFAFAPSGDRTDDPEVMSLYVADSAANGWGRIVELAFVQPVVRPAVVEQIDASLVQIIDSSQFEPPSPDPSGAAFISDANRLMVSDSEVNEMPIYDQANVFEIGLSGSLVGTWDTTSFSSEPAGVAYKPDGQRLYFVDDSNDRVYEVSAGTDARFGTGDDILTSFSTRAFGSMDPEGIAYEGLEDRLFIVDGVNAEVYEVKPGANGIFDGVDDEVSQFDTAQLGILDPEGIAFNPDTGNLYVVGDPEEVVAEITTDGDLMRLIDISEAIPRSPAGLAYGLRSNDRDVMSLYVSDRGVDNDSDPNENDGKIYEFGLDIAASTATPTPVPSPTPSPTPGGEPSSPYMIYFKFIAIDAQSSEMSSSGENGR